MKLLATLAFAAFIASALAAPANFSEWVGHQRRNFNPDGKGAAAGLYGPAGLASDGKMLFLAENYNNAVRNISWDGVTNIIIGGDGSGSTVGFWNESRVDTPVTLALSWDNTTLFVQGSHGVNAIDLATTNTSRKVQSSFTGPIGSNSVKAIAFDANGTLWYGTSNNAIYAHWRVMDFGLNPTNVFLAYGSGSGNSGYSDGIGRDAQFNNIVGLEVHYPEPSDLMKMMLVVAESSSNVIRGVHTGNQSVFTLAGVPGSASWQDGPRGVGMLASITAIHVPRRGLAKHAYIAAYRAIRRVDLVSGELTTILGGYNNQRFNQGLVYGMNPFLAAFGSVYGLLEHDNRLYVSMLDFNTIATLQLNHSQVFTVSAAVSPSTGVVAVAAALVASLLL